jgi:hypothetical protein
MVHRLPATRSSRRTPRAHFPSTPRALALRQSLQPSLVCCQACSTPSKWPHEIRWASVTTALRVQLSRPCLRTSQVEDLMSAALLICCIALLACSWQAIANRACSHDQQRRLDLVDSVVDDSLCQRCSDYQLPDPHAERHEPVQRLLRQHRLGLGHCNHYQLVSWPAVCLQSRRTKPYWTRRAERGQCHSHLAPCQRVRYSQRASSPVSFSTSSGGARSSASTAILLIAAVVVCAVLTLKATA